MKCKFCEREFKNKHGLHIHWFYCWVKAFKELLKKYVGNKKYDELMGDARLISVSHYFRGFVKFAETGEIGIKLGVRYILERGR